MIRRCALATLTLAAGYAVAAGCFWGLVNVPESNVLALMLSAALALATLTTAGVATAAAAAIGDGVGGSDGTRRAIGALPGFAVGLGAFAVLWWVTGSADTWWRANRGQIDATLIRYANITRTRALHQAVFWATWIVRWIVGLSVVAALVTTSTVGGMRAIPSAFRHAVRGWSLASAAVAVWVVWGGLWRVVYWRPAAMTPWIEPTFVAVKLAGLYLAAMVVVAGTLVAYRAAVRGQGSGRIDLRRP